MTMRSKAEDVHGDSYAHVRVIVPPVPPGVKSGQTARIELNGQDISRRVTAFKVEKDFNDPSPIVISLRLLVDSLEIDGHVPWKSLLDHER